jgi:hypothetical protein
MSTFPLTRRAAIAALGAMTIAALAASRGALARSTLPRPGVRVDVAPLAANAGEPTAGWVAQYLPGQIAQNLARRGVSANVSVRIDYLTLGPNSGGVGPAGSSYDSIQGVATINGVEMPVRATSSYYPMAQDATMTEQSNRDRISQVTEALAFWIAQDAEGIAAAGPRG